MLLTCEDAKFLGFSEFLRRGVRPDQPRPGRGARRHTRQAKAHSLNSIHRAPRNSTGCGRRTGQPGDWTCRFARVRRQRGVANCAHRVASYRSPRLTSPIGHDARCRICVRHVSGFRAARTTRWVPRPSLDPRHALRAPRLRRLLAPVCRRVELERLPAVHCRKKQPMGEGHE